MLSRPDAKKIMEKFMCANVNKIKLSINLNVHIFAILKQIATKNLLLFQENIFIVACNIFMQSPCNFSERTLRSLSFV